MLLRRRRRRVGGAAAFQCIPIDLNASVTLVAVRDSLIVYPRQSASAQPDNRSPAVPGLHRA